MNKAGAILAGCYAAIASACVIASLIAEDAKGGFVLLQLPIALQGAVLSAVGLGPALSKVGWLGAYALIGGGTMATLYGLGRICSSHGRRP